MRAGATAPGGMAVASDSGKAKAAGAAGGR